ncbi:MAG: histidine--tRNA ligase [Alphaproteobacteria bacterium]|nr:MAG: histidine--tRNA ligase [Alphaproteobacteria bacterium]
MQPIRGFRDLLQNDFKTFSEIKTICETIAKLYGYEGIELPIVESLDVFKRTLGDVSDVVNKEMFTLTDRHGEILALRPEATASVVRALISNKLTQDLPQKFFYQGPMFRYERPQKGRYRQFYQFGIEAFGEKDPYIDAEIILLAHRILEDLGVKGFKFEINTIGDVASRKAYNDALIKYLTPQKNELSQDSQERLLRNPLRILDSKDMQDQKILMNAPKFEGYLNEESKAFFESVCGYLDAFDVTYHVNSRLVRGLDYYTHTVFEFTHEDLGAQSAFLAGGRYDGLVSTMGGPDIPGIGFAMGIDRVMFLSEVGDVNAPVIVIPFSDDCLAYAMDVCETLRDNGVMCEVSFKGKLSKDLKYAEKRQAEYALLIGENEVEASTVTLKFLGSDEGNQTKSVGEILDFLAL